MPSDGDQQTARKGKPEWGIAKSVRTRSWSALQQMPQGEDGATLTVMPDNHQSALPSLWFRNGRQDSPIGRENQFAADQTR